MPERYPQSCSIVSFVQPVRYLNSRWLKCHIQKFVCVVTLYSTSLFIGYRIRLPAGSLSYTERGDLCLKTSLKSTERKRSSVGCLANTEQAVILQNDCFVGWPKRLSNLLTLLVG